MTTKRHDDNLPSVWSRPFGDRQPTLFPSLVDEALTEIQVTKSDVRRWKENGWVSFDIDSVCKLDWTEIDEIRFVRQMIMSGLGDQVIDKLLSNLPRPFRYAPDSLAYHFTYGWVVPTRHDPFDIIEEHLDDWLDELTEVQLHDLREKINERIENLEDQSAEDEAGDSVSP